MAQFLCSNPLNSDRRNNLPPIRTYTNWNTRPSDNEPAIEPYRKYFFICEGRNTETWYFQKLIDLRKTLEIRTMIDIRLLEKTEFEEDIQPNAEEIIRNEKFGNQRFIYSLLLKHTNMNSKKNPLIGELAHKVKTAIVQERKVNQDIYDCKGKITSNIGMIIDGIIHDNGME